MRILPCLEVYGKCNKRRGFISLSNDFLLVLVLILVATASFGLGRLSYKESVKPVMGVGNIDLNTVPASVYASTKSSNTDSKSTGATQTDGSVVGSKNGTKYHYPWCPGAKQISEVNMVYFTSIEKAREAGYTPAGNCKGLE